MLQFRNPAPHFFSHHVNLIESRYVVHSQPQRVSFNGPLSTAPIGPPRSPPSHFQIFQKMLALSIRQTCAQSDRQRILELRWLGDSQRDRGNSRESICRKVSIFTTFERFARIASDLRFAIFCAPKRDLQKRVSVLEPFRRFARIT